MNIERATRVFPNFIRDGLIPPEAKEQNIDVYRICKWGKIEANAFICTYQEVNLHLCIYRDLDLNDPSTFSTSCFEKKRDARNFLKLMTKKYEPHAILAKGQTESSCGVCQKTSEREPERTGSHVDWWLYLDSKPEKYFEEVI